MDLTHNAPTDNLYKFIAITGVVLIVLSIVFPLRWYHDTRMKSLELEEQRATFEIDFETWRRNELVHRLRGHETDERFQAFLDKHDPRNVFTEEEKQQIRDEVAKNLPGHDPEQVVLGLQMAEMLNRDLAETPEEREAEMLPLEAIIAESEKSEVAPVEHLEHAANVDKKRELLRVAEQRIAYLQTSGTVLAWFGGIMFIVGLALACKGFSLWYSRLQRYEDIVIANRAKVTNQHEEPNASQA